MDSRLSQGQRRYPARWRWSAGGLVLALALFSSACTDRQGPEAVGPLSVGPTAVPTGPASSGPGVAKVSEDIQAVDVQITDDGFASDVYSAQARPMRIEVSVEGGPYTLAIDNLMQPREIDADGTTIVSLAPSAAGDYTMRLSGAVEDTAMLNVRAAGNR